MEQLKVKKKDPIVLNTILFLLLSFLFLYLQYAYRHQLSPVSVVYLRKSLELFWYVFFPMIVAGFLVWRLHHLAAWAFGFCVLMVSYKVVEGLFIEFNKIIVIALFFYTVIAYFLYQLLDQYWRKAYINPNYRPSDLFSPLLTSIPCLLTLPEKEVKGILTNWDEEGCFLKLEQSVQLPAHLEMKIFFQDREFLQAGEVVAQTIDSAGAGIKFEASVKNLTVFNWAEFTELIQELGYQPERLR